MDEYQAKKGTVENALDYIQSGDHIALGFYGNEPVALLRQLHTIAPRVEGVKVWTGMLKEDYPFAMDTGLTGKIDLLSTFFSSQHRRTYSSGHIEFVPADLRNMAEIMRFRKKPRVFVCAAAPMDEEGYFSVSSMSHEMEMLQTAEVVILEINPRLPRTFGQSRIHISQIDCFYDTDNELFYTGEYPSSTQDRQIAEYVASLIHDGDTLQFGVGGMPECVGEALYHHKDLGIHTEMLGNALGKLMEKGVVNNSRKNFYPGKSVCGFIWGNEHLYQFMDGCEDLMILPTSYVNTPYVISKNNNLVSVNTALEVDLTGQVCSESIGSKQYSGTGGAFDFACGAFESPGGRGIIAIRSTAKNDTISKIQVQLTPGSAVSISRNVVDYVVTEYGIAELRGVSIRERARRLIAIAHPDFRQELTRQAHDILFS